MDLAARVCGRGWREQAFLTWARADEDHPCSRRRPAGLGFGLRPGPDGPPGSSQRSSLRHGHQDGVRDHRWHPLQALGRPRWSLRFRRLGESAWHSRCLPLGVLCAHACGGRALSGCLGFVDTMFALCAGCAHHPDPVQHPPLWRQGMPRDVVPARVLSQRQQLGTRPCGVLAVCWRCRSHGAGSGRLGVRLGDGLNRSCENPLLCSGGRLLGVLLSARSRASGASRTGLRARVCWLPPTQRALCWESGVAVLSDDDELPGRRQLPIAQRSERHAFAALVASAGGGAAGRSVEERGTWRLFSLTLRCLSCLRVACWPGLCVCARAVCLCVRCVRVCACVRVLSVCLSVCLSCSRGFCLFLHRASRLLSPSRW